MSNAENIPKFNSPSVLLFGPFDARYEDGPIPQIVDPRDVIIRIAYTGVCGSDVHFWVHGGIGAKVSQEKPLTLGHEASGIIHAVGNAVTSLVPGDRVAIEPGYPCRRCEPCKAGRYHLCSQMKFAASPPDTHGTLTKYFRMPEDYCYKIPDDMSLQHAVLMEPLSVGVHAVRLAGVAPDDRVVVFGAGTVGLFCAAVAREFGASVVVSVDLLQHKLDFAAQFVGERNGRTLLVDREASREWTTDMLRQLMGLGQNNQGADVVIDATGAESAAHAGVAILRPGGTYVQAGMGKAIIPFPIQEVCAKELNFKGCFRYGAGDFRTSLDMVRQGKIKLDGIVTQVLPFNKATEAWETTRRGEGIKTMIECFPN